MARFLECALKQGGDFAAVVEGSQYSCGGRGHNMLNDGGECQDGPVIEIFIVR